MIIDFSTHIYTDGYRRLFSELPNAPWGSFENSPIARMSKVHPAAAEVDERRRVIEQFADFDYRQVLCLVPHPIEDFADPAATAEICSVANEDLRMLVEQHPDCFVSALGAVPLVDPDAALRELDHIDELGLPGVQINTHVGGLPLDHPTLLPVVEEILRRRLTIFLHPARGPMPPDFPSETQSRYTIWQQLGWPYMTSVTMLRLAFAGLLERMPDAVIVTHHLGGMIPYYSARLDVHYEAYGLGHPLGSGPTEEKVLEKPLIDSLRLFYGDTSLSGGPEALACGLSFLGSERVIFGSDMPMDLSGGREFIPRTIEAVEQCGASQQVKHAIYEGNARRVLKLPDASHSEATLLNA